MSAVAPLTVCAGVFPTTYAVTGMTSIPAAMIMVAVILAVFSIGYVAMAKQIVNAGAFYSFVARGLGRPMGVGAAFVAVAAYNALQVALYGALGASVSQYLAQHFGWHVAWWVCAGLAWAATAVLGNLAVDLNGRLLAVLLVVELVTITAITVSGLTHPAQGQVSAGPLLPSGLTVAGSGALLVIAVLAFTGFEQAAVFSEEVRDPRRTINVATFVSVGLIGILYAGASWAMTVFYGVGTVADAASRLGPASFFRLGGPAVASVAEVLFLTSLFAAMLSFHNAVSRYMFALGRERVLPAVMGHVNPRTSAPQVASLAQSTLGLLVIAGYAAAHLDPMVNLFFWLGTAGGFGVLILLCGTSAAVIGFSLQRRNGRALRQPGDPGVWASLVAPAVALAALLALLWRASVDYAAILGVPPESDAAWAFPLAYLLVALAGVTWGLVIRQTRPLVYNSIGMGPMALALR
ncbi:amino acid permease [Paractinoplanes durhamensis]|uniref:Amino acid permease n=1 Tax=Paractinoplanes durhamensis TaxID=113563 RepID=A0ABQ3Z8S8_9ACTN|nr:amino acid permease [Actinoplanes durhamensis]